MSQSGGAPACMGPGEPKSCSSKKPQTQTSPRKTSSEKPTCSGKTSSEKPACSGKPSGEKPICSGETSNDKAICSGKGATSKLPIKTTTKTPKKPATTERTITGKVTKVAKSGIMTGLCVPADGKFPCRGSRARRAPARFGIHEHVEGWTVYQIDSANHKVTKAFKEGLTTAAVPEKCAVAKKVVGKPGKGAKVLKPKSKPKMKAKAKAVKAEAGSCGGKSEAAKDDAGAICTFEKKKAAKS